MLKLSVQFSGFHLDPEPGSHILEHDGNRLDDQLIWIGLAIDNDLMLRFFAFPDIQIMLAGKSVYQPLYQVVSMSASPCHVPAS
jgi:hypothetical protein